MAHPVQNRLKFLPDPEERQPKEVQRLQYLTLRPHFSL